MAYMMSDEVNVKPVEPELPLETPPLKPSMVYQTTWRKVLRLALIGLAAGLLIWAVRLALEAWLLRPLFCRTPDTATICLNVPADAYIAALVLVGALLVGIFKALQIRRSAWLIILATLVGLWPFFNYFENAGNLAILWCAGFNALLLSLFNQLMRIKRPIVALGLVVVIEIAIFLMA
jgi:hypothetical protein